MSLKRINAIPSPGMPPHAIPLYALPSADVVYNLNTLYILRGGITLGIPATVDADDDLNFKEGNKASKKGILPFLFTVKNVSGNPEATITDFSVDGNIELIKALFTSNDPTGNTVGSGESFKLCFFTTYDENSLNQGVNNLSGSWEIGNTFAGFPGVEEEYVITINYRVILPYQNDNSRKTQFGEGRIAPNVYIDEWTILNKKEKQFVPNRNQ